MFLPDTDTLLEEEDDDSFFFACDLDIVPGPHDKTKSVQKFTRPVSFVRSGLCFLKFECCWATGWGLSMKSHLMSKQGGRKITFVNKKIFFNFNNYI